MQPIRREVAPGNLQLALQWVNLQGLIYDWTIHGLWEGGWNLNGFNVKTGMPVKPICETAEAFNIKVFNAYTQDLRDLMERNWPNRHIPASIKRYCDFWTSEWERHGVNLYKEAETYFSYTSLAVHDLFNAHGQDFGIGRSIANNNQRILYHPLTAAQVSQHLRGVLGVEVLLVGESIWDDNGILFVYYISEVRIFYDRRLEIMINAPRPFAGGMRANDIVIFT